ncbi:MAG: glycosyltransferase family 2 protein [Planctomycetota bacterium]
MSGRVTVVIPTYNRAALLPRAIASALAQTVLARCEIVVVDDGSTDETPEVARRFASQIRYLRQSNRGLGAARNAAIRMYPHEFVALLDDDDEWLPDKIERQLAALQHWPAAVLVSGRVVDVHPSGRQRVRPLPAIPLDRPADLASHLFESNCLPPSAVVLRTRPLQQVGLFHERLRGVEDHHAWMRLACRGPGIVLSATLARYAVATPGALSSATVHMLARQLQARYLARPALRRRPDCRAAWRRGLLRSLTDLRDASYRRGDFAAAARHGLHALLHDPLGRSRWEWRRTAEALLRAL